MKLDPSNSKAPSEAHRQSPTPDVMNEQQKSVDTTVKSINAPHSAPLPSNTKSEASDVSTIVVSGEESEPISAPDHKRLVLLAQVVRIIDKKLVYYNKSQSIWVYIRDELGSLKKMVLHPIETMFRGTWGDLLWSPSEVENFNVGSFHVTGLISDYGDHGLVVTCTDHNNWLYAMKIERSRREISADVIALAEISLHPTMFASKEMQIPRLRQIFSQYGKEVIVMECLGPDLRQLSQRYKPFSVKTLLQVAISLLTAYEQIHKTGWLHLTPKPVNFCIGGTSQTKHKIYVVDFGRAQRYMEHDDSWNLYHRKYKQQAEESPQGDAFQSVWGEKGQTTSRRDDIMSLSLALLTMAGHWTPWENTGLDRGKWIRSLGWGFEGTMVKVLDEMLVYSLNMRYGEEPAYERWRERIRNFAHAEGIELDGKFDWDDMIWEDEHGRIVLKKPKVEVEKVKKEKKSKMEKKKLRRKWKREQKKKAKKEAAKQDAPKTDGSTTDGSDSSSIIPRRGMDPELQARLERGQPLCRIQ